VSATGAGRTPADKASIRTLLIEAAEFDPDVLFVSFEDGVKWLRRDVLREARRAASCLTRHGVGKGDLVIVSGDNCADWLRAWWGIALLGAVIVPVNPSLRGQMLADVVERVKPRVALVEKTFRDHWANASCTVLDYGDLADEGPIDVPAVNVSHDDIHAVFFTSGTTGQSKGSLCANTYFWEMASWRQSIPVDHRDVFLADLPFYHTGAVAMTVYMLAVGGRIVVRKRPSLSNYWETVGREGVTVSLLVGSMVDYLIGQPPRETDRQHSLRTIALAPLPQNVAQFSKRFGVPNVVTTFGSTEMGSIIVNPPSVPVRPPSSGKLRESIEARLVDAEGNEVPVGKPGELLIRSKRPLALSQGYLGQPEETRKAWSDGWFHSGDRMYRDADGYYYFFDRLKDSLRRRGENISTHEVEREVLSHPDIQDAACVGVADDPGTDEEIKVFVIPKAGAVVDFMQLTLFLSSRMPHYMVPRFFELIENFPRTATGRVRKFELRALPNTGGTWDRQEHGIIVKRDGVKVGQC